MINFYVTRIQTGIMTVGQVPTLWRTRVQKALEELEAQREETHHERN